MEYSGAPQRSPEWFNIRRGRVTASRLSDWTAVSKAKGAPLKARLDYERELMFERQFGRSFETYVNSAMQDGIDFEDFAAQQYERITGNKCEEVGCWYNDYFVASPDRSVGEDGLIEVKIVKDNTFCDVLTDGVPEKHWKQIQGQLWASGRAWCDYVCLNFNTNKVVIIRVLPDTEFHAFLEKSVQEELTVEPFTQANLYEVQGTVPDGVVLGALIDRSDNNINDWSS